MKRIGIDARLYFQTGVGVYIRNLLHFLQELDTNHLEFYVYVMKNEADTIVFTKKNFNKVKVDYKWHSFSEQTVFLYQLIKDNLDLMHFTYFSHPIFYNRPFISTIHDVILLEHKTGKASTLWSFLYNLKHAAFKLAFNHQIFKSDSIVTPTEIVKKQITSIYGKKYESKIVALHEGVDFQKMLVKENTALAEKFDKKFFLYVGNFYPHKNVERLIRAFDKVKSDIKLVLVGPSDFFSQRIKEVIKDLNLGYKIVFYPNASDEDLIYLYKHAEALVHPSLSEGFGLPILEAAYFGTPVIASDIPVFSEVLGDEYVKFDPKDTENMTSKIEEFLKVKTNFNPKIDDFSFEKMSKELLKIYSSI